MELKQDAKKELSIIALSGSEVDKAEPFDNASEWLDLLDFRVRMMDQNFFESHRVFGLSELGDHLVADGLIFDIPVKAFGGLETLVETFAKSDVMSNIS